MPTFQVTILGNVFMPGTVVSATLRIVAQDQAAAEAFAIVYAQALGILGSRVRVDSVYQLASNAPK